MHEVAAAQGVAEVAEVAERLRPPKTAELIAAHVRRKIVRGEFAPHDALPSEGVLQEEFGVSRPTLREAFRILEAERLIEIRRGSHGGARVLVPAVSVAGRYVGLLLQMDRTPLVDVYDVRMIVEPAAAGMLARRRTERDLADLRECLDLLDQRVTHVRDVHLWWDSTHEFHTLVLDRAGNHTLAVQAGVLWEVVAEHLARVARSSLGGQSRVRSFGNAVRSYRRLADLVEQQDAGGAERHWRLHMEAARHTLFNGSLSTATVLDLFH